MMINKSCRLLGFWICAVYLSYRSIDRLYHLRQLIIVNFAIIDDGDFHDSSAAGSSAVEELGPATIDDERDDNDDDNNNKTNEENNNDVLLPIIVDPTITTTVSFEFPTEEERVEYYMGGWYYNNTTVNLADVCKDIPFYNAWNGIHWRDLPYIFHADNAYNNVPPDQGGYFTDAQERVFEEAAVSLKHVVPWGTLRVMMMLGDADPRPPIPYPIMAKVRPAANTVPRHHDSGIYYPILMPLATERHYDPVDEVVRAAKVIPWNEKIDKVLFRGSSTGGGKRAKILRRYHYDESSSSSSRRRQSSSSDNRDDDHDDLDLGFHDLIQGQENNPKNVRLLKPVMSIRQQLRYKYFLSIEGNDVATSLKWMLYAPNSVVFKAPATRVSWAMEDKLVPFVHYIPLLPDSSNLRQMLAWARSHQDECREISLQATEFIEQLHASEAARRSNRRITRAIVKRYHELYGPALSKCTAPSESLVHAARYQCRDINSNDNNDDDDNVDDLLVEGKNGKNEKNNKYTQRQQQPWPGLDTCANYDRTKGAAFEALLQNVNTDNN